MEMRISRSDTSSFEPRALSLLRRIPASASFHVQHGLRHPAALYFMSLQKIGHAYIRVAKIYTKKRFEYRLYTGREIEKAISFDLTDLLHEQEALLKALQEHLDDCYLILKCLLDPLNAKKNPLFADQYIQVNLLKGVKTFLTSIEMVKKSLTIANKLKHEQGRLKGVLLIPGPEIGYYIESPGKEGALGPMLEIHPGYSCLSFSRDLAVRLFRLYQCSESLCTAILANVPEDRLTEGAVPRDCEPSVWGEAVGFAIDLPKRVFPGEASKGTPSFRMSQNDEVLILQNPDPSVRKIEGGFALWLSLSRDGYSDKLIMPVP